MIPVVAGCLAASLATSFSATPLPVADLRRESPVDFETEVLPALRKNCLACHNQTRAKADLVLETPASIAKGGASGTAVVPGNPEKSLLFTSAAHRVDDLVMPPLGNKANAENLTPSELAVLQLWIRQGAKGEVRASRSLAWQPIPDSWQSSYAVAIDRNAHLVACARANRVDVYDARTGKSRGRLEDPGLQGAAQRDVVSSIAFSPVEDIVATAGFREVRLWRLRAPVVAEVLRAEPDTEWSSVTLSPDGSLIALITTSGDLRVHRVATGESVSVRSAITTTPARLAFAPDGRSLAVAGASGTLRIVAVTGASGELELSLGGAPADVAWFDSGRALATLRRDSKTVQTWRMPEGPDARTLVPGKELGGHDAPVVSLAPGPSGTLFSASRDGSIRRWTTDGSPSGEPRRSTGAIRELRVAGNPARVVAVLESGGCVNLDETGGPDARGTLAGDPRLIAAAGAAQYAVDFAKLELGHAEKTIQESEAETKKTAETLAKAREKRDANTKAHAEKQQQLADQRKAEAAATAERDQFAAELKKATEEWAAAEKAANEARGAAKEASERSLAARLAADQAARLKTDLDRLVASLEGRPDEAAVRKAREAAEAAASESAAKTRGIGDTTSQAEKALEDLAKASFAAGRARAAFDRAQAELPPKQKQADERIAEAKKSAAGLEPQVEKARVALEGSDKDVQLAEQGAQRAELALRRARESAETAKQRIAEAESHRDARRKASAEAGARSPEFATLTPSGSGLLARAADGTTTCWDLATGAGSIAFADEGPAPIGVFAVDEHAALVVRGRRVSRVDFSPRWERFRTIGGDSDASSNGSAPALVDRVNALAFAPDGSLLATAGGEPSRSGEIKLWRVADGSLVRDFGSVHSDCVLTLAFSPRGDRLASGGADRFARVCETSTGKLLRSFEGHTHHVMGVAWLAHGGVLASAGAEGTVKIWNPSTGERLKNVDGFGKEVTGLRAVGLAPQFAAVSGSGTGRIVRDNGEKVRDLPGTSTFLQAMDTTADGAWAAVAGDDGTLRIWDLASGKERFAVAPK